MTRILVVDDAPNIRTVVRDLLEAEEFQVETAGTLAEAEAQLAAGTMDLMLLDLELPDGTGIDLCKSLREHGRNLPIVMLTGRTAAGDRTRGLDCGADDYLGKPFDADELLARVRAQLRRQAMDLGRVEAHLRVRWEQIQAGLRLAHEAQQPFSPIPSGLDTAVRFFPVGRVGGDFYLVRDLDEHRTAVLIGDSMGRGLAASLVMASTLSLLSDLITEVVEPLWVITEANRRLRPDLERQVFFVSAFYGLWDRRERVFRYASAGHESPIWIRREPSGRRGRLLRAPGHVLGAPIDCSFEERIIRPEPGDRLFFYTDGLTDSCPTEKHACLFRSLYRTLLTGIEQPLESQAESIMTAVRSVAGDLFLKDDVTFFFLEIPPL